MACFLRVRLREKREEGDQWPASVQTGVFLLGAANVKKRILVVEDHPDCRDVLVFYLRHMGYQPLEAQNGEEGIQKTLSESPDLIILDLGLPDMSGIEVASLLSQDPNTRRIPIVVHSAWSPDVWKEKAVKVGVTEYLSKPAAPPVLREIIERLTTADTALVSADKEENR